MLLVGLTGGIGTGKSAVARILRDRGVPVIDADQVAREVVAPGSEGLADVVRAFGPKVLDDAGALDRPRMRARIAADPEARRTMEAITHPRIRLAVADWLAARMAEGAPAAVVEAALLVETGQARGYPVLILVTCRPETQLARVVARDGMSEASARALIAAQLPLAEKAKVATHIVDNDGSLEDLRHAVDHVWEQVAAVSR